jgi:L-malate glycosyltransferase
MVRILYFTKSYTVHDFNFLTKISNGSYEVFFLSLDELKEVKKERPFPESVQTVSRPRSFSKLSTIFDYWRVVRDLKLIIKNIQPDLIHAGPIQSCGFLVALARFHPLISMSWGSDLLLCADTNLLNRWITQYTLSQSTKIIGDCNAVRKKIHELVKFNDSDIITFPWGIKISDFTTIQGSKVRDNLDWNDKFIIISTRNWEKIYGLDLLLKSFFDIHKQNDEIRLILLGGGSMASSMLKYINKHKLSSFIHIPGYVSQDQLYSYLRSADLYVSASLSDGSSVSLLEAMAIGVPIIVSDIPGNREWISNNVNGLLFEFNNYKSLAQTISFAVSDYSNLLIKSKQNLMIINKYANWDTNINKLFNVYDEVIEKNVINK